MLSDSGFYAIDFVSDIDLVGNGSFVAVFSNKILIKEAKSSNVALLVYGSPLFATTHMSIVLDAEKMGVRVKVIYSASVLDGVAETGLQLYKFGKTASMAKQESDFLKYVEENDQNI